MENAGEPSSPARMQRSASCSPSFTLERSIYRPECAIPARSASEGYRLSSPRLEVGIAPLPGLETSDSSLDIDGRWTEK